VTGLMASTWASLPHASSSLKSIKEDWIVEKDTEKLQLLLEKRYLLPGACHNMVPRFPVAKGKNNIHTVWDLHKNGLNTVMYTPSFYLPCPSSYTQQLEPGMLGANFDVGEQFHIYLAPPN